MTEQDDLRRDVIKSESAEVSVPELDMQLGAGTLGGLVTTVEGLLANSRAQLESVVSFKIGDSALQLQKDIWGNFRALGGLCGAAHPLDARHQGGCH